MAVISKKHWYSYGALIITLPLCYILIFKAPPFLNNYIGGIPIIEYARYIPALYGFWLAYVSIFGPIRYASAKWIFEDDCLTVKSPSPMWNKGAFQMDISEIYEAYYKSSFLGNVLGYAELSVRRTDGTTTAFSESKMTNYNEIVGAINERILELKKIAKSPITESSKNSLTDELQKLSEMHQNGILSDEEFTEMKRKLAQ